MMTLDEVRAVCLGFPGVTEKISGHGGGVTWRAAQGQFAWERGPRKTDLAQLADLGRTWPDGTVLGIRTDGLDAKAALLQTYPGTFFEIPHFEGFPAVLSALATADPTLLRETITEAWLIRTTPRLRDEWLAAQPPH
nr:hypothetical protein [Microbacterium bovistercoris]